LAAFLRIVDNNSMRSFYNFTLTISLFLFASCTRSVLRMPAQSTDVPGYVAMKRSVDSGWAADLKKLSEKTTKSPYSKKVLTESYKACQEDFSSFFIGAESITAKEFMDFIFSKEQKTFLKAVPLSSPLALGGFRDDIVYLAQNYLPTDVLQEAALKIPNLEYVYGQLLERQVDAKNSHLWGHTKVFAALVLLKIYSDHVHKMTDRSKYLSGLDCIWSLLEMLKIEANDPTSNKLISRTIKDLSLWKAQELVMIPYKEGRLKQEELDLKMNELYGMFQRVKNTSNSPRARAFFSAMFFYNR